jgi:hypothetical protein
LTRLRIRIRICMDPHWFGSLNPDPLSAIETNADPQHRADNIDIILYQAYIKLNQLYFIFFYIVVLHEGVEKAYWGMSYQHTTLSLPLRWWNHHM